MQVDARAPRPGVGLPLARMLTLVSAAVMLASLWHHEPWSDELNAWGLVLASPTPFDLFHNLAYEGHPGLWHLMLWCASAFGDTVSTMKVVHGIIAIAVLILIGLWFPLTMLERVLLLSNYYVIFEYSAISRNYAIGLLLVLCYCRIYAMRQAAFTVQAVLLGLLANTNAFGLILSGILVTERVARPVLKRAVRVQSLLPGMAGYGALLAIATATILPAPDVSRPEARRALSWASLSDLGNLWDALLHNVVTPFIPLTPAFPAGFSTPGLYWSPLQLWLASAAVIPLTAAITWVLRRDIWRLLLFAATLGSTVLFTHMVYSGSVRHWGITFVAFLAALWLARTAGTARSSLVALLLAGGSLGGIEASVAGWLQPFSNVGPAARWVMANSRPDERLIGYPDMQAGAVAITLHRSIYLLECACDRTFVRLDKRRDDFNPAVSLVPGLLRAVASGPALFISGVLIEGQIRADLDAAGLITTELARFTGGERDRSLAVYRIR